MGQIILFSGVMGAGIGLWQGPGSAPLLEAATGALVGCVIGGSLSGLELFVLSDRREGLARRLSPLSLLALRAVSFVAVILLGLCLPSLLLGGPWPWQDPTFAFVFVQSVAVAVLISTGVELTRLLGREATLALLTGRYTQPRLEDRVVLFADLVGSTALAERVGDLRFHQLLQEVALDLAPAIDAAGGEVHRYVGDAVIVTWPLRRGVRDAACLACAAGMHAALAARAAAYEAGFGHTPRLRIAVHCGPVAAGEIGEWKKEIALLGDTMNTAARLETAAREHSVATVLSDSLAEALPASAQAALHRLPDYAAAGKQARLGLWSPDAPAAPV